MRDRPDGRVSLVGAGPGDPDLLTWRAMKRLEEADLVLYDALVDPDVLLFAPRARHVSVGKRAGRAAVQQEFINRLMIRAARRGARIVRLKGGDPFVFGRGGEEALALARAGIPFEVVPGVTSAVAAPALAGIPVTHRGLASAFVVVAGHAETAYGPVLQGIAANTVTIVVMMGLQHIGAISATLLGRGWSRTTPAAVLMSASRADGEVWTLTLGELERGFNLRDRPAPGTVVIGEVVRLRAALAPFQALAGEDVAAAVAR
jgi:uroporphyrin-III C-methyltransferase/precorrin-2 dehydrogenase/sirohydrochlorin ferrochelatase